MKGEVTYNAEAIAQMTFDVFCATFPTWTADKQRNIWEQCTGKKIPMKSKKELKADIETKEEKFNNDLETK